MVLAPEHPLVAEITTAEQRAAVEEYVTQARRQSEIERLSTVKEKTGVFTGAYARNLFTGKDIPIWIADYVLMGYGTGAIMARARRGPARLRIREQVRPRDSASSPRPPTAARRPPTAPSREHGITINSRLPQRDDHRRRASAPSCKYAEEHEIGKRHRHLPDARLADLAPALLGLPDPDRLLQDATASCRCPTSNCRSCCPT